MTSELSLLTWKKCEHKFNDRPKSTHNCRSFLIPNERNGEPMVNQYIDNCKVTITMTYLPAYSESALKYRSRTWLEFWTGSLSAPGNSSLVVCQTRCLILRGRQNSRSSKWPTQRSHSWRNDAEAFVCNARSDIQPGSLANLPIASSSLSNFLVINTRCAHGHAYDTKI